MLKQVSKFMSPHRLYNASLSPTVTASQQICPCLHITTNQPTTFYAKCQMSGYSFLIDTGACRSFVPKPPKTFHLQPYIGPVISTADGQALKIEGCINIDFIMQGQKYKWEFVVANGAVPILGADFLASNNLAVDMANQRLLPLHHTATLQNDVPPAIRQVLEEFKEVFSKDFKVRNNLQSSHLAIHRIKTRGRPQRFKFRRLAPN